jgi:hypothetical protein
MPTYQLFIHDTRYSVPTLVFVTAATEARARARAIELLRDEARYYQSIEVVLGGADLFTVTRPAGASGDGRRTPGSEGLST